MASAKGEAILHSAVVSWWRSHQRGCGEWAAASCGPGGGDGGLGGGDGDGFGGGDGDGFGSGTFGVRRPLRFLAYKLGLDQRQVSELAKILDELKTERAQSEVDRRRTLSAFADAVGSESFDQARANEAADLRLASAARLRDTVTKALAKIHALLRNDQRERMAYLIRTGVITL